MPSTYLTRTVGTPSSNQKFTISVWVKRTGVGGSADEDCICGSDAVSSQATQIYFKSDDTFRIFDSSSSTDLVTSRLFRDPNGYYHIVIAVDTSLGTASDRIKLYVNGVQETSFGTSNYSSQNSGWIMASSGSKFYIGVAENTGGAKFGYMDGVMSHFHFVDNQQYNASVFGSEDSTTGEWKINTSPTITMGNMGFTVLKDGMTITDQSSNSNDFTLGGGTLTKTEDNPSNIFATLNELARLNNFSQRYVEHTIGNTKADGTSTSNNGNSYTTLGASSGKFYCEAKINGVYNTIYPTIGVIPERNAADRDKTQIGYNTSDTFGYTPNGQKLIASSQSNYGDSFTNGDIIGIALDLDNGAVYFSKNGSWQNSGDPTSGSSKTNAAGTFTPSQHYFMGVSPYRSQSSVSFNFGNGYFGTTQISSEGTNASGLGKFEYDVPAGYTALCTKGLNN